MSNDDPNRRTAASQSSQNVRPNTEPQPSRMRSLFSVPPPIKRIFDQVPLITYAENELPVRAPAKRRNDNVLYVFTTKENAKAGRPSFNPACLKWQTYLKLSDIPFELVASNNHASPSGALPFLLPGSETTHTSKSPDPVAGNKLRKWLASQKAGAKIEEPSDMRYEAYASLLDHRIRKAWLYQLYLTPTNASLVHRLYVAPCSTNNFVQMAIAHQLRSAAEKELVKAAASSTISEVEVMKDAEEALDSLSTLLGDDEWFFGLAKPSLFDASMFAYSHLLLDEDMEWTSNTLSMHLKKHRNLVEHRQRIVGLYF